MNKWHQLLLCTLCLLMPYYSVAQQPKWPRNSKSGKIEFSGVLPWPVWASDLARRQELVHNWYVTKLTDEQQQKSKADFTSAELLKFAYLDSTINIQDKWKARSIRLLYQVRLFYTLKGLIYRLSDFECVEIVADASNSVSLEEVLSNGELKEFSKLAAFYKRLRLTLNSW